MDCDPYFAQVSLLLHNDTFAFADSSSYNHTVQLYPDSLSVLLDTSIKKFGAGSAHFPFGPSTMIIADAPEFDLSTGDWTIEGQVRFDSGYFGTQPNPIIRKNNGSHTPYNIGVDVSGHILASGTDIDGTPVYTLDGGLIAFDTFVYFALTRHGSTFTLRVGGTTVATATSASALDSNSQALKIGGNHPASDDPFHGWIDELRITKGVCRYLTDFTPPTAAFPGRQCNPNDYEPARWIKFGRALRLPHVLGGTGKFQNEREAIKAFIAEAQGDAVFARYALDCPNNDGDIQVDITHTAVSTQPHDSTT